MMPLQEPGFLQGLYVWRDNESQLGVVFVLFQQTFTRWPFAQSFLSLLHLNHPTPTLVFLLCSAESIVLVRFSSYSDLLDSVSKLYLPLLMPICRAFTVSHAINSELPWNKPDWSWNPLIMIGLLDCFQVFWTRDKGSIAAVSDNAWSTKYWCLGLLVPASSMEASLYWGSCSFSKWAYDMSWFCVREALGMKRINLNCFVRQMTLGKWMTLSTVWTGLVLFSSNVPAPRWFLGSVFYCALEILLLGRLRKASYFAGRWKWSPKQHATCSLLQGQSIRIESCWRGASWYMCIRALAFDGCKR